MSKKKPSRPEDIVQIGDKGDYTPIKTDAQGNMVISTWEEPNHAAMNRIKDLYHKCKGDVETYRKSFMKEISILTNNDNFKSAKLYNDLRKSYKKFLKGVYKIKPILK